MFRSTEPSLRQDLQERRERLENFLADRPDDEQLGRLLQQVDAALIRLDDGTYGICEACGEAIEPERLAVDPLLCLCLDHLTASEQRALEQDLELSARIQHGLLPSRELQTTGWECAYHYRPAGLVSGDYCDLLESGAGLHFVVGDVTGKGVSAAMLMSNLQATFRALVAQDLPLGTTLERASRMFCEVSLPTHFATLACGCASLSGEVSLASAGHPPILVARASGTEQFPATGLPLGMFCESKFEVHTTTLAPGDTILLYSDGFVEASDDLARMYGVERASARLAALHGRSAAETLTALLDDLGSFLDGRGLDDDLTVMVLRRAAP
jgi:sigma-B regulation protein RsbU (phosphoserine phosphatase)